MTQERILLTPEHFIERGFLKNEYSTYVNMDLSAQAFYVEPDKIGIGHYGGAWNFARYNWNANEPLEYLDELESILVEVHDEMKENYEVRVPLAMRAPNKITSAQLRKDFEKYGHLPIIRDDDWINWREKIFPGAYFLGNGCAADLPSLCYINEKIDEDGIVHKGLAISESIGESKRGMQYKVTWEEWDETAWTTFISKLPDEQQPIKKS